MRKPQPLEVGELKYILQDSLTEDDFAQLQTAEDIINILKKGNFIKDLWGRQKLKNALKIIGRNDLAADVNAIDICPMKGLTKGNRSHLGYGWMNYKRSKNELRDIAIKIFKYKFKREYLEIYDGADTEAILEYPDWEERCKRLLDTFFSRDGRSSGVILFPDIEIPLQSQICQVEKWQRLMITLNDWCKTSSSEDATGLVIRNYDLRDHLNFRRVTENEIKDTLGFNHSANMFHFQESDTRFLVFNPSLKIILTIRLVELQKGDSQLIRKEVHHLIDEVNLLCFLLRDELADTRVILTGFVAYSGKNAHSLSACKDCDNMIFSFEIFNSVEYFKKFLKNFFREKEIKDLAKQVARNVKKKKTNVFQAVASQILGYLSHLQFVTLREPVLPVTEQDATDNIKQAELLLNCYQMEIAYSDDKRIWLEGNYGTGKTVVALKKLDLLLKAVTDKEVIYYVSFARKSLLDLKVKQRFEKSENVRIIRSEYSLSNTIRHWILPEERKIGTKNIHLIMDEYNSENLSTKEAESLIPILNEVEELRNSTVLIAVQPIKISRVDKFCEAGIKKQFSEAKHELDKLITATGVKVKTLKNVMRTTVQINKFSEITQECLDNQSSRCVHQAIRSNFKEVTNFNSSFQSRTPESNVSLSVTSDSSSNRATKSLPYLPEKLIDYDEMHKLVDTETKADEENFRETVTSYRYTCHSQIGHGINGPLPKFIKFAESVDLYEQVALIATVLDKIIEHEEAKPNRVAVIHFEPSDPPLWLKSLFQLENISRNLKVTYKTEKFLKDDNKNLVLVKNVNFVRGLEFSKVLLILDSDEHHMRHLIPEAIARCTNDLSVLIRPPVNRNHKSNTDEWEKNLDNRIIRMLKIGFCLEPSCNKKKVQQETCCKDEIKFGTSFRIHKNSKLFKDFLREIKRKKIGNVQPEYKDKQREAEAVLYAEFQDKKCKALLDFDDPGLVERFINAAQSDNINEVIFMLQSGVPIDSRDENGYTALHWAAVRSHTDVVEKLLELGADVNMQNRYHWTPLHAAAQDNNTHIIQALLLHGAKPFKTNNKGQTALQVARAFNREEAIRLLE